MVLFMLSEIINLKNQEKTEEMENFHPPFVVSLPMFFEYLELNL